MLQLIRNLLNRKRTCKAPPPPANPANPANTYMGMPLTVETWPKIVGYAAYDAALPLDTIDNLQCQRAYIAAAILTGGSNE